MTDKAIINASPLIFLSRSHHLALLKNFADEVWRPEPVAEEILQRGQKDITAQAIKKTAWLITQPVKHTPNSILEWRLGAGESLPPCQPNHWTLPGTDNIDSEGG